MANRIIMISVLLLGVLLTGGASYDSLIEGLNAYDEGEFLESIDHFKDSLNDGGNPDTLNYNIGSAEYKAGLFDDAFTSFRKALDENPSTSDEFYNLGNSLAMIGEAATQSGALEDARDYFNKGIEAFEKTLELDYTDLDAIHNIEYLKKRLEELEETVEESQDSEEDETEGGDESGDEDGEGSDGEGSDSDQEDGEESDEESDSSEEDDGNSTDGEESDQSESGEQSDPQDGETGEDESQDESQNGQNEDTQQDDGLNLQDGEIDDLLEYFERKERSQQNPFQGLPMVPPSREMIPPGLWEQIFGSQVEDDEAWIDW